MPNPLDEILSDDLFEPLFAVKISFRYLAENAIGSISLSQLQFTEIEILFELIDE